jgi:hypothetical protein
MEALRLIGSKLAFIGFLLSCSVVGAALACELCVWLGLMKRKDDDQ